MEVDLLQSTTGVDLARILCSIVQSLAVVETSALLAQNSLLWHLLVKRCQLDGVEMFSGFTAIDKRFPFGALNRVEKTAAEEAMDSGEGEDSDDMTAMMMVMKMMIQMGRRARITMTLTLRLTVMMRVMVIVTTTKMTMMMRRMMTLMKMMTVMKMMKEEHSHLRNGRSENLSSLKWVWSAVA